MACAPQSCVPNWTHCLSLQHKHPRFSTYLINKSIRWIFIEHMLCSRCSDGADNTSVSETESCPHKVCRVKYHHLPFGHPKPRVTWDSFLFQSVHIHSTQSLNLPLWAPPLYWKVKSWSVCVSLTTWDQTPASLTWTPGLPTCISLLLIAVTNYQKLGGLKQHKLVVLLLFSH